MEVIIKPDDLTDGKVIELLEEHHREMQGYSPPESIHALKTAELFDADITFWSVREGETLAACGALKQLSEDHGEIKSMRTASAYRRRGVAEQVLMQIIAEARRRNYQRLSLETGSNEAFVPAMALYTKHGFEETGPFGSYKPDPFSRFFTLDLSSD